MVYDVCWFVVVVTDCTCCLGLFVGFDLLICFVWCLLVRFMKLASICDLLLLLGLIWLFACFLLVLLLVLWCLCWLLFTQFDCLLKVCLFVRLLSLLIVVDVVLLYCYDVLFCGVRRLVCGRLCGLCCFCSVCLVGCALY